MTRELNWHTRKYPSIHLISKKTITEDLRNKKIQKDYIENK